jgi:peptidoglycan/LPS O-acetylase OafA/YrhL
MSAPGRPDALPTLTGIRGIAAWLVVLFHVRLTATAALPPAAIHMLGKGYLAVDLFFMLSGFVLYLNYADRLRERAPGAVASFLARRIARIWPLHVVVLVAAIGFATARLATGHPPSAHYPFGELPLHVLMIQNWGFTDRLTWNDPAWSISCEFAAYLLFPLLVLRFDWRRLPALVPLGALALLALAIALLYAAAGAPSLNHDIPRFGLARALCEFAMGTIACGLWLRWRDRPAPLAAAAGAAALAFAGALAAGWLAEPAGVPGLLIAALLLLALGDSWRANPLATRAIVYLGEISYSTYLVHFLLFVLFKILFVADRSQVPLPLIGLFLATVLAASVLFHHGVERPAQAALNRRFDAWRARRRGLAAAPARG